MCEKGFTVYVGSRIGSDERPTPPPFGPFLTTRETAYFFRFFGRKCAFSMGFRLWRIEWCDTIFIT